MASSFPALKGVMGDLEYYITMMKLGELVKQVGYAEDLQKWDEGIPSEYKKQRKLNMSRVTTEMVPYLTANPDHFYAAITAEVERPGDPTSKITFEPTDASGEVGLVKFDGSENIMALDGQHRLKSIELALKDHPDLARESVAVILVPGKGFRRSQQLFSDLNRYAKQPSKTLNLLFEHREFFAGVAKEVAENAATFKDRVNLETNSLGRKTRHHITLAVLYECVVSLLDGHYSDRESDPKKLEEAVKRVIHIYDDVIVPALPEFQDMLAGRFMPYDLRCKYIYPHSVGEQAIAKAVRACQDQFGAKWEDVVKQAFPKIDWRLVNSEWEGSAVQGGSIYTRRQNVEHTATFLKLKLGVPIPQVETDSLKAAIEATDPKRRLPEPVIKRRVS
jgi:DNA sulfur modification protein DndB